MTTSTSIDTPLDLNYAPQSYFFPMGLDKYLLATVKGTQRRNEVERLIAEGRILDIEDWLAHSALDGSTRELIGSFHPKFMGGEYLPNLGTGEVEIARIELASVTSDVISIRAKQRSGRIYYSIQDEYETNFKIKPAWSKQPLTLNQIIGLIETATDKDYGEQSLGLRALDDGYHQFDFNLETCRTFTRVTSAFYLELEVYYSQAIEAWYQQCVCELEVDEEDDDD